MPTTGDLARVERLLNSDRVWTTYALADLQDDFAGACRWLTSADGTEEAVALLYSGLEPPVLFAAGAPDALERALAGMALPPRVYLSVREEHLPVIEKLYDNSGDHRPMYRMILTDAERAVSRIEVAPERLTASSIPHVETLLAWNGPFTPDAFAPYQVEQGVFYGVWDNTGALVAVGGTHIVDWTRHVAAIGNMYTRPDRRGCGYATAILAALVQTLRARNVETIVLNVDQRNQGARHLYEEHGFVVYCPYVEGIAVTRGQHKISS